MRAAVRKDELEERDAAAACFEHVYARWVGPVYRFCLSQLRDRALAEDVTAEVFASALAAFDRSPDGSMGGWLFRIARNAVVDEHRRRHRHIRLAARLLPHGRHPHRDPLDAVAQRDDVARAGEAISRLRPRDRELVGLRVGGQLSYAEIGGVMGMSETAAKVATHRALTVVRRALRDGEGQP
jgi:RNA polymerase sigma-70 factor (ECF subfamily)